MPGQAAQPPVDLVRRQPDRALERRARPAPPAPPPASGPGRCASAATPRRGCIRSCRRGGLHPQPPLDARARSALAEPVHQRAEAGEGLLAGDLLLDDRGHERLHHQAGAGDPPVRVLPVHVGDGGVVGHEAGRVVVGAEHRRHAGERPVGARPPGGRVHDPVDVLPEPQRRRALGGPDARARPCRRGRCGRSGRRPRGAGSRAPARIGQGQPRPPARRGPRSAAVGCTSSGYEVGQLARATGRMVRHAARRPRRRPRPPSGRPGPARPRWRPSPTCCAPRPARGATRWSAVATCLPRRRAAAAPHRARLARPHRPPAAADARVTLDVVEVDAPSRS